MFPVCALIGTLPVRGTGRDCSRQQQLAPADLGSQQFLVKSQHLEQCSVVSSVQAIILRHPHWRFEDGD